MAESCTDTLHKIFSTIVLAHKHLGVQFGYYSEPMCRFASTIQETHSYHYTYVTHHTPNKFRSTNYYDTK